MEEIKSAVYAILGMQVLIFINQVIVFARWEKMEKSERHIPMLESTTRRARLFFQVVGAKMPKRPRKLKNIANAPTIPDAPEEMVVKMARWILKELERGDAASVNLTDTYWIKGGTWKELTGGTPSQFYAVMGRLEAARIWRKLPTEKGNGKRVLREPYGLLDSRLRRLLPQPAPTTAKTTAGDGVNGR